MMLQFLYIILVYYIFSFCRCFCWITTTMVISNSTIIFVIGWWWWWQYDYFIVAMHFIRKISKMIDKTNIETTNLLLSLIVVVWFELLLSFVVWLLVWLFVKEEIAAEPLLLQSCDDGCSIVINSCWKNYRMEIWCHSWLIDWLVDWFTFCCCCVLVCLLWFGLVWFGWNWMLCR